MKTNNGHLAGMNSKEIKADVLSHMVIYTEAKNSSDNNKENPQNGNMWIDSFSDDIVAFILGNDIKDWVEIPDQYINDDIERQNFIHFIRWNNSEGITPLEEPSYEEWTEDGCTGGGCHQCRYCDECPTGQMSEY